MPYPLGQGGATATMGSMDPQKQKQKQKKRGGGTENGRKGGEREGKGGKARKRKEKRGKGGKGRRGAQARQVAYDEVAGVTSPYVRRPSSPRESTEDELEQAGLAQLAARRLQNPKVVSSVLTARVLHGAGSAQKHQRHHHRYRDEGCCGNYATAPMV